MTCPGKTCKTKNVRPIDRVTQIPADKPVELYVYGFGGLSYLGKAVKLSGKVFFFHGTKLVPWSEVAWEYENYNHVPLRVTGWLPATLTTYEQGLVDARRK